jgi:hypothetical protein
MRKHGNGERSQVQSLTDLHIFRSPEYEIVVFGKRFSLCMYVSLLAPELLDIFYSCFILKSLSIAGGAQSV